MLVEDLTTADLLFSGRPPAPLAALEPDGVVAVGSFSKVLWGGLRAGWLRADPALVLRLGRLKAAHDLGTGLLDQAACVAAMPRLAEITAARRAMAASRYELITGLISEQLPDWRVTVARGGYSLWAQLPGADAAGFAATALEQGVAVSSGGSSAPEDLFLDHLRLCFTAEPDDLRTAVEQLASIWRARSAAPAA